MIAAERLVWPRQKMVVYGAERYGYVRRVAPEGPFSARIASG
jgi:hypothetical protein